MHEYTSTVRIWELSCPGYLEEIGRARRWTRDVLSDSDHADDAALIVTELGTNALLHSASGNQGDGFNLTISRTPQAVSVSVTDSGGTRTTPHVEHPDENDTHGRGLALVASLARRLHVYGDDENGHTVTAELKAGPQSSPEAPLIRGYWCECTVNGGHLGAFDATSPEQALRWVRISLMTIAIALDDEPFRQAQHWKAHEQPQALEALRQGEPQDLTLKHRTTQITWTARPVTFLPMAHRQGRTLPACTQRHSTAQLSFLSCRVSGEG
ncbi:ATP-binding protein [Streptomyces ovatisporus]|uniref:ATP-binding protein n=1 Tax=Streptomyces ovatisporus TaxID=1128682 RepID=A0ABV9A953_9ACTN